MKIISCSGFECEKELKTTLEDLFNQSDVVYEYEGQERTLNVTYVRYFDEYLNENQIYEHEEIPFYQIAALLILLKSNGYVDDKRLYFNDTEKFLKSFHKDDIPKALEIYQSLS